MSSPDETDPIAQFLAREAPFDAASDESCPDANALAGLLDDRLLPEEREQLEHHLARCESCRSVVAAVAPAVSEEAEEVAESRAVPFSRTFLAAAALLVGVSLGVWGGWQLLEGAGDTDARLLASAEQLADARPQLFGRFQPLTRNERLAPPSVVRGNAGPVLLQPTGHVLALRSDFVWETVPGGKTYVVELMGADGTSLWRVETEDERISYPAEEPALEPGQKYLWRVTVSGVLGESTANRLFSVATAEERLRIETGLAEIRELADPELAELLAAHFAIRNEVYSEAERAARRAMELDPDDAVCVETLVHVLRNLGSSEADTMENP